MARFEFHEYNDIPSANGNLEDIDIPKRSTLKNAYDDNLLVVFRTCHNHIYVTDGLQKQPAFFELLKVIFCKTLDEQKAEEELGFFTTSKERSNQDGQLTVQKRIGKIFNEVKNQFPQIFDKNEKINLKPRSLAWIVAELQPYSLLNTHVDVKGKAYEELVGSNLRGDRGEFFTPRNVMKMAVEMINPTPNEKVCDTSCGTGGFLVSAMNHVIRQIEKRAEENYGKPKHEWSAHERRNVEKRISQIAAKNFYGFDINPDLVRATKMNMVMNNDGAGNIYQNDSLLPPHEWSSDFKNALAGQLGISAEKIIGKDSIEFFDVIVTNPPFGSKIPIRGSDILSQYNLGYIWRNEQYETNPNDGWTISDDQQTKVPPDQLFIERCIQFLKPGGRLAIVLPDSILSNPGLTYIRQWLIENTTIIASIDLHVDTFQPRNGTQTSLLIVQKKTSSEIAAEQKRGFFRPYMIFMAMVEKVGHDKRGNTIFKRDKSGNEIWIPDSNNALEFHDTADGNIAVKAIARTRVVDDQTPEIPNIFAEWKKTEGIAW